jgi:hypothetical protein
VRGKVSKVEGFAGASGFRVDPDVVAERVGDETVLVHLVTNRIYELRGTGPRIFELLQQGLDRQAIAERLGAEYAVEPAQLAAELDRLLAELREREILR